MLRRTYLIISQNTKVPTPMTTASVTTMPSIR